ncbi:AbrB/MazE/SpoVT family DNA-binding domain-containing protein [Candidatus Amarobacter glycogenicus]|uniref:AbrB/MazE/SpoVT family DNA-binding domain-containing protein n=1 Tax=Candidatus Amarobacter glycogenicus TaxID=3140699 RepID=UPI003136B9BC|nr:AbrB/MazE/SpoVT family DNA-binding domain-containing protein [Dehalococcoidia bacterium]
MHTKVSKWGNSLAVRIPAAIAEQVNITCGDTVDLKVVNGQLVVVPARVHVPTLDELLDKLDPGTLHGEVNWGRPVGNGAW